MNKTDFLADIASRYSRIGNVELATNPVDFAKRQTDLNYSFYRIPVEDLAVHDGVEVSTLGAVLFKVFDEGEAGEKVVLDSQPEREIQRRPTDTVFADQVRVWYTNNKPVSVVKFELLETNKKLQFAILRVFDVVADVATEKKIFLYKQGAVINAVPLQEI